MPSYSDSQASQVLDELAGGNSNKARSDSKANSSPGDLGCFADLGSFSMDSDEVSRLGSLPHLNDMLNFDSMPPWPTLDEEDRGSESSSTKDYMARQNHLLRKACHYQGFRTPSSLGSPRLSGAPTEAPPSPRQPGSSGNGSLYGASDDAPPQHREFHTLETTTTSFPSTTTTVGTLMPIMTDMMVQDFNGFADAPTFSTSPVKVHSPIMLDADNIMQALMEAPQAHSPAR
jgi:hypothetical protein